MKHEEALKLLNDYVDANLSGAEKLEFENHLEGCLTCSTEIKQLRALLERTGSLQEGVTPSRDLWPGIAAAIEKASERDVVQVERETRKAPLQQSTPGPDRLRNLARSLGFRKSARVPALAVAAALAVLLIVVWSPNPSEDGDHAVTSGEALEEEFSDLYANTMIYALEAESRQADIELKLFSTLERKSGSRDVRDLMLQNLNIVDQAIAEVIEVWRSDLGDPQLTRRLVASLHARAALQGKIIEISTRS